MAKIKLPTALFRVQTLGVDRYAVVVGSEGAFAFGTFDSKDEADMHCLRLNAVLTREADDGPFVVVRHHPDCKRDFAVGVRYGSGRTEVAVVFSTFDDAEAYRMASVFNHLLAGWRTHSS